jgi:hypothetical protein
MSKTKLSQGKRIALITHLLATDGAKSFYQLKEKFSMVSDATLRRDLKLLRETKLVVETREARNTDEHISRKIFIFFKDYSDIVGKTKDAMEKLKKDFCQITLEQIASKSGLPPDRIETVAYNLAPKLEILISQHSKQESPDVLFVR